MQLKCEDYYDATYICKIGHSWTCKDNFVMYGSSVAWVWWQHSNRELDSTYSLQFTKFCHFSHNFNECLEYRNIQIRGCYYNDSIVQLPLGYSFNIKGMSKHIRPKVIPDVISISSMTAGKPCWVWPGQKRYKINTWT